MIRCPGCGGRNHRDALSCEWCHLPFIQAPQRGLSARWWGALSGIVIGILLLLVGGLAFLNATRSASRTVSAGVTPSPPPLPPLQVASPSPAGVGPAAATPTRDVTAPSPSAPSPMPTSTPTPRFARIANTGGLGANLRREPATTAPAVTVLAESAIVRLLGPEQQGADGRLWRQVDDGRGNQGWIPSDLLVEAPAPAGR